MFTEWGKADLLWTDSTTLHQFAFGNHMELKPDLTGKKSKEWNWQSFQASFTGN